MKDHGATAWSCWLQTKARMRIGLVSDTHIPQVAQELSPEVARALEGVDLILHAGDIYAPSCLDWLEQIAAVRAVEMGAAIHFDRDPRVAYKQVLEVNGHSIGLAHDLTLHGMRGDVRPGALATAFPDDHALQTALQHFFGTAVDIVVFGHTHEALVEAYQGVLLVNPGSPTVPDRREAPGSVAILELAPGRPPSAQIVDLPTPS